ncbi:hypothetical protein VDGE_30132 [Verticillium dahliae]|uniref:Uncharacterized protein n=1 Tax=Verticillium dahliae TaxID=27337 RepID=A0A444RN00_VERDA|nr:hypothetical protein VDGE_30132 [Verticillium dahliae]
MFLLHRCAHTTFSLGGCHWLVPASLCQCPIPSHPKLLVRGYQGGGSQVVWTRLATKALTISTSLLFLESPTVLFHYEHPLPIDSLLRPAHRLH